MEVTNYPPTLHPICMGADPPKHTTGYKTSFREHFENYRNETISRMLMPSYQWDNTRPAYVARSSLTNEKSTSKFAIFPQPKVTNLDPGRQQEVDDFYLACQYHRDQYKDQTGAFHPLDYFKKSEILYQCPPSPTTTYLKYPERHVQYKSPPMLPLTYARTRRNPSLPERALTGVYNASSDRAYKR